MKRERWREREECQDEGIAACQNERDVKDVCVCIYIYLIEELYKHT